MGITRQNACFIFIFSVISIVYGQSIFSWIKGDRHSQVQRYIDLIENSNCNAKSREQLMLPNDVVSQIPKFNELRSKIFYRNRTALVQMHNMALNRAMFFSFILQKLNRTNDFAKQPNWMYIYMGMTADMNGNKDLFNGSMVAFDNNCYYPNWMPEAVPLNKTMPLFAAKAWRADDTFDMGVYLREPTGRTNVVKDIGSGSTTNYTNAQSKNSPWYDFWLPDNDPDRDSVQKFTYSVGIKYSNQTGSFMTDDFETTNFFGPNSPGQSDNEDYLLPVRFTRPYFDCGDSNVFIVSAAAPVVDYMPRYSNFTHLRRPRFVGVVTMDIHFQEIDYNACGISAGNPGPCFLCGVARCPESTVCKHVAGRGFRRGGYKCDCPAGQHFAWYEDGPFKGTNLEKATNHERENSFKCYSTDFLRVPPNVENTAGVNLNNGINSMTNVEANVISRQLRSIETKEREKYTDSKVTDNSKSRKKRKKRSLNFDEVSSSNMERIFAKKRAVTAANCKTMSAGQLELPGDAAYGANEQFDNQARMALRISHLLSNFLQNVSPNENFGILRGGGRIYQDLLFGEVLANVMSDFKIVSTGILYEPYIFENQDGTQRELFGPTAWKAANGNYFAHDAAGLKDKYIHNKHYLFVKERWQTNTKGLLKYRMKPLIRNNANGTSTVKHENFPMGYKALSVDHGFWTNPYFKCDGRVDKWVITYMIPFIGKNGINKKLTFKGAVYVDIPLDYLDINQCAQPFHVPNAFKNTARCDYQTQKCSHIPGYQFTKGNYKCACKRGYEYPFRDGRSWVHGSLIELEYLKKQKGYFNLYDAMKCRVSSGEKISNAFLLLTVTLIISIWNFIHKK